MNLTKLKLSKEISDKLELSQEDSIRIVNSFFQIQKKFLKSGNLKISKFGSFNKSYTPKRIGRNPKTLQVHLIPRKSKISFRASKIIKAIIN